MQHFRLLICHLRNLCVLLVLLQAQPASAEDLDRPPINYAKSTPNNVVTKLQQKLASGKASLPYDEELGYLPALLRELRVPLSSQMFVFSKTSLQRQRITPKTPRAIYFNDDVYIGYCHRGEVVEISAVDPQLASGKGGLDLRRKQAYVNHYTFHIWDEEWGHVAIRMCGHPPFSAMLMLNGHEYVAAKATEQKLRFGKEGNCFTELADAPGLQLVADTLRSKGAIGRLLQVGERWLYQCLCFAVHSDDQQRTNFRYALSLFQLYWFSLNWKIAWFELAGKG